jgi:hypothetical protein
VAARALVVGRAGLRQRLLRDDNSGHPVPCVPTTAPECGACKNTALDYLTQCFTDADCIGFVHPLTCMNASGTTPGTCG